MDWKGVKGKAEELDPIRKVGKSEPEDNLTVTEGYQEECHKKDGEGQHELRWQQRQTLEPTRNSPRDERAGARRAEEREIWAEENEKKDWNLERQTKASRKRTFH